MLIAINPESPRPLYGLIRDTNLGGPAMNREDKYMTQHLGFVLLGLLAIMFALIILANVLV